MQFDTDEDLLSQLYEYESNHERYKSCKSIARCRVQEIQAETENGNAQRFRLKGKFSDCPDVARLIYDDLQQLVNESVNQLKVVQVNCRKAGTQYETVVLEFRCGQGLDKVKTYLDDLQHHKSRVENGQMKQMLRDVKQPPWLIQLVEQVCGTI
eukprot:TRINITY_DN37039_c0_g1_i1.p2 TRINITY_DN37039_c0_g1~~TRINITY_DN37039_c0_g1_i1.p2  ORF type:complete len:154 (-),score=23.70 TRINITY_DN37039_c0_g1_i1:65-526(-)